MSPDKNTPSKEFWVVAEINGKSINKSTFELVSKARSLAENSDAKTAVIILGERVKSFFEELTQAGVQKIYFAEAPDLIDFQDEVYAQIIADMAKTHQPEIILGAATVRGRSLMPRIAVLLDTGLTADCTSLEIHPDSGQLLQTRPAFGGNLLATILCQSFPQMATVRPHVFKTTNCSVKDVETELVEYDLPIPGAMKENLGFEHFKEQEASITDAKILISAGMGTGGPEGIKLLKELAKRLNAGLSSSRSVVDSGWLDYSHQVGQTGVTVHPDIYLACGISGAIQHLVGMQDSGFIIAINKDREAPIFNVADVAICGDVMEVIPALLEQIN
jgi:electron transfer flavoprotein alpha subunit